MAKLNKISLEKFVVAITDINYGKSRRHTLCMTFETICVLENLAKGAPNFVSGGEARMALIRHCQRCHSQKVVKQHIIYYSHQTKTFFNAFSRTPRQNSCQGPCMLHVGMVVREQSSLGAQ